MKAFREERNTMHTKRALGWVSSVAVLAATAVGVGVPLASPAFAAEGLTAVAEQPRYPVGGAAVFDVTVTQPVVGNQLGVNIVSGPDQPAPSTSCTTISAQ